VSLPNPSAPLPAAIADAQSHPLDRVIWSALTSQHASFALSNSLARRYPAEFAPFAAVAEFSTQSYEALAQLLGPQDTVALFTVPQIVPPARFKVLYQKALRQMIGPFNPSQVTASHIERLGAADVPEMLALIDVTKPGPFSQRTQELGHYFGIRVYGQLVAMAGERMRLDGYTEISAVCAHPDFRGRGYPRDLILTLANQIVARGERPFLHVLDDNQSAIALYEKLGFTHRQSIQLTVLSLAA